MRKTRTLTIEGDQWIVEASRDGGRILNPGKFEGNAPHAVRDYLADLELSEDSFGGFEDILAEPYHYRVGHRGYYLSDQGFVHEYLTLAEWEGAKAAYDRMVAEEEDLQERLLAEQDALTAMESEEDGPCDSCQVASVNEVRCHEEGCPRYARLAAQRRLVARLEEGEC